MVINANVRLLVESTDCNLRFRQASRLGQGAAVKQRGNPRHCHETPWNVADCWAIGSQPLCNKKLLVHSPIFSIVHCANSPGTDRFCLSARHCPDHCPLFSRCDQRGRLSASESHKYSNTHFCVLLFGSHTPTLGPKLGPTSPSMHVSAVSRDWPGNQAHPFRLR